MRQFWQFALVSLCIFSCPLLHCQLDQPVASYSFDTVPSHIFTRGQSVTLKITTTIANPKFSVKSDRAITGIYGVDAAGVFTFAPNYADSGDFVLTLAVVGSDGTALSKSVIVSNVAPEFTLVGAARKIPSEDDIHYLTVTETEDRTHRDFNYLADRKVVNVVISGKKVVFDKAADLNGLWSRFNSRADIESLSIYAETLILRSRIDLPETDVRIHARKVQFIDQPGLEPAAIVTTPVSLQSHPGEQKNGAQGIRAGSMTLFVGTFESTVAGKRFVLSGGNGQDAGLGRDGTPGRSKACIKPAINDTCVVHVHRSSGPTTFGQDDTKFPENGSDALVPGAPGAAGSGGDFQANLAGLEIYVDSNPGSPGKQAPNVTGGAAGTPIHALGVEMAGPHFETPHGPCVPAGLIDGPCTVNIPMRGNTKWSGVESRFDSSPGKSYQAPAVPAASVNAGAMSVVGLQRDWLHPFLVRAIVNHAQDAYLNGNLEFTAGVLDEYLRIIDESLIAWNVGTQERETGNQARLNAATDATRAQVQKDIDRADADHDSLVNLKLEMVSTTTRIANNLDYFGHPAGWVPQLSLAASLKAFDNEISAAIPILYLSYYAQTSSADRDRHLESIKQSGEALVVGVKQKTDALNKAQDIIPQLSLKADSIQVEINNFQDQVEDRKRDLVEEANHIVEERNSVPFWKQALNTLSAVAQVCPIGQPVVGSVGKGLNMVASVGQESTITTIKNLGSLSGDFSQDKVKSAVQQYHDQVDLLDPGKAKNARDYVKRLAPVAEKLADEYKAIDQSLQNHKASSPEIENQLAQLEAGDSRFNDLITKVRSLNDEKQDFATQLASALDTTSSLSSEIMADWHSVDSVNVAYSELTGEVDHQAVQDIAAFGRRTRDRLLLYQYYMAKAYEYRTLRPYTGELNLNKLADSFIALQAPSSHDGFHPLTPEQFAQVKAIYIASVREVVGDVLQDYNANPAPHHLPFSYKLTPAQLDSLNNDGELVLDLGLSVPRFRQEDNRHLLSIKVSKMSAPSPNDSAATALRLTFEHKGTSTFRSRKQSFLFDHHGTQSDVPFEWGGAFDGTWVPEETSVDYLDLLKTLLSLNAQDSAIAELFAHPGLDSQVVVRREAGETRVIKVLQLSIDYDYERSAQLELPVDVIAPIGLEPIVTVSLADNSGRSLGQGTFTRMYPENTTVTFTAPAKLRNRTFIGWHLGAGAVSPGLSITLNTNKAQVLTMEYAP